MFLIKLARYMFDNYLNLQKKERRLRKKKEGRLPRLKSLQHLTEVRAAGRQDKWVGSGERVIKSLGKNIQTGFTWATDLQHSEWHLLGLNYPDVGKFQLLLMKGRKKFTERDFGQRQWMWDLDGCWQRVRLWSTSARTFSCRAKFSWCRSHLKATVIMEMFIQEFFAITLSRIDYHSAHPFELQRRKITFWTRRVKSFHTCTAPSPPPARPFSERNIYCYFRHHRHCQYLKSSFNVLLLAFWIFVPIGFRVEQVDSTSRYAVLAAAGTTNSCYIAILSQQWHGMVDWNWPNKP